MIEMTKLKIGVVNDDKPVTMTILAGERSPRSDRLCSSSETRRRPRHRSEFACRCNAGAIYGNGSGVQASAQTNPEITAPEQPQEATTDLVFLVAGLTGAAKAIRSPRCNHDLDGILAWA